MDDLEAMKAAFAAKGGRVTHVPTYTADGGVRRGRMRLKTGNLERRLRAKLDELSNLRWTQDDEAIAAMRKRIAEKLEAMDA